MWLYDSFISSFLKSYTLTLLNPDWWWNQATNHDLPRKFHELFAICVFFYFRSFFLSSLFFSLSHCLSKEFSVYSNPFSRCVKQCWIRKINQNANSSNDMLFKIMVNILWRIAIESICKWDVISKLKVNYIQIHTTSNKWQPNATTNDKSYKLHWHWHCLWRYF